MVFKTVDLSIENEELLSIIENNCSIAVAARNEIRNTERLHKAKKVEVKPIPKKKEVEEVVIEEKVNTDFEDKIKCFLQDYLLLEEDKNISEEKNNLILVPTTGGNIRVISELENVPAEYIPLFKELFDSIVDGTFKGLKGFNNNNTLNGVSEVRGNGVRVVFKRLSKKSYAIITAFIKRSTNDAGYKEFLRSRVADFRLIQDSLKNKINDEEFIKENNLYVEELYNILNQGEKTPKDSKGVK